MSNNEYKPGKIPKKNFSSCLCRKRDNNTIKEWQGILLGLHATDFSLDVGHEAPGSNGIRIPQCDVQ